MKVNEIELNFSDKGEGSPILLLHGLALDKGIWEPLIQAYASQARFITPDLRGHGKTELGNADGSLGQIAEDLRVLLDALALEKVSIAGHSMGGYIALEFAKRYPERLNSLILVTSNIRPDSDEKKAGRLRDAESVLSEGVDKFSEGLAERVTSDPFLAKQMADEIMKKTDPAGLSNILKAIANRQDQAEMIQALQVPVLSIAGAEDRISDPSFALEGSRLARNGHQLVIPGVGHLPMLENPMALGAVFVSFQELSREP